MSGGKTRLLLVGLVPPELGGGLDCGVATHVWDLARQSARRGYEVSVLAPLGSKKTFVADGVELLNASRGRFVRLIRAAGLASSLACRRTVRGFGLKDKAGTLAWIRTLDDAVREFRPDLIHIHPLTHPAGMGLDCLHVRPPVVMTDHGFWQHLRRDRDAERVRRAVRGADGIIAVSEYCLVQQDRYGVSGRVPRSVILNPVDFSALAGLPDPGRPIDPDGRKTVIFAAGVDAVGRKGLDILLEAFARSESLRASCVLHVIADDEGGGYARPRMDRGGIAGRVWPRQPRAALLRQIAAADVLVLPSRSESFGLVLVEALAAGVPVVGFAPTVEEFRRRLDTDIGDPFDANEEGPEDLAGKIEAVTRRRFDRPDLAGRTRRLFSWDVLFPEFDRFYKSVLRP